MRLPSAHHLVAPAKAGAQARNPWIPACAGMTGIGFDSTILSGALRRTSVGGRGWVNSHWVSRCRASRTRGCCAAAAAMSTTWCCRAWSLAMCCARRMPMRGSARSIRRRAKAAPGVLAVLTGADWEASGWRDLPSASGNKRRDGSPCPSAALPGIGQGPRALGRRLRRVCRRRDPPSGGRRRRTDRGRLRDAAGDRLDRGRDKAGRAARLGRVPRQHLALSTSKATKRRPTRLLPVPRTSSSANLSSTG